MRRIAIRSWVLSLAALVALGAGAVARPEPPMPADFRLTFVVSARPAGPGDVESIELEASGRVRCSARLTAAGELPAAELRLPAEAVAAIHAEVAARRFFELSPVYSDPEVADGDLASLAVTAGGRTHRVTTINVALDDFDAIVLELLDRLPPERRIAHSALHVEGVKRVER
jgi:hypothetical protein